jgi:hypothetical protein
MWLPQLAVLLILLSNALLRKKGQELGCPASFEREQRQLRRGGLEVIEMVQSRHNCPLPKKGVQCVQD